MNIGFESIAPTPSYPHGLNAAALADYAWTSTAGNVVKFKRSLKAQLRTLQSGRCCYCRRMLPADTMATDIEHFVEKAAYPHLTFEVVNLAISCKTCNSKKNKSYLRLCDRLTRKASKAAGVRTRIVCCPTVRIGPSLANGADYRWVHPHLDTFSDHIALKRSWIYMPRTTKGFRSIQGMELNALASLEHRAASERLASRKGSLSFTIGVIAEMDKLTASAIGSIVANELKRRMFRHPT